MVLAIREEIDRAHAGRSARMQVVGVARAGLSPTVQVLRDLGGRERSSAP